VNQESIETALRLVSPYAADCADQILDLRDSVMRVENPGRCVRCYFSIYGKVAERAGDRLLPLRHWLENHIEVVARDESERELERLPVLLDEGEDLQAFCERMMREIQENRVYPSERIDLRFDFRDEPAKAA